MYYTDVLYVKEELPGFILRKIWSSGYSTEIICLVILIFACYFDVFVCLGPPLFRCTNKIWGRDINLAHTKPVLYYLTIVKFSNYSIVFKIHKQHEKYITKLKKYAKVI